MKPDRYSKADMEGIIYPRDARAFLDSLYLQRENENIKQLESLPAFIEVPHKAWKYCIDELFAAFSSLEAIKGKVKNVFILGPLHKGKVSFDDPDRIYCNPDMKVSGTDWTIELEEPRAGSPLLQIVPDADILSEEYLAQMLYPFIARTFPEAGTSVLLCAGDGQSFSHDLALYLKKLCSDFPFSVFFVSNNISGNSSCCNSWIKAIGEKDDSQ